MDRDGDRPIVVGEFSDQPIADSVRYPYGIPTFLPLPPGDEDLAEDPGVHPLVLEQVRLDQIQDPVLRRAELARRWRVAQLEQKSRNNRC